MINDAPLLRTMLLSALIGFVVFCGSYSLLVWAKRRKSTSTSGKGLPRRVSEWSFFTIALGCVGLVISLVVRESVRAEGSLRGEGFITLRAKSDLRVAHVARLGPIEEGDPLVRFSSPVTRADAQLLELTADELRNEMARIAILPLPGDPELIRLQDQVDAERRLLISNLNYTLPTHERALQDLIHNVITQRDMLAKIDNDLKIATGEHKQAFAKLTVSRQQLTRERELAKKNSLSSSELNEREKEVGSLEAEVTKLAAGVTTTEERQRRCKEGLDSLEKLTTEQRDRLDVSTRTTKASMQVCQEQTDQLKQRIYEDRKVAQMRRDRELESLNIRIRQAETQLAASRAKGDQMAPSAGKVIFRHPSPESVANEMPLLVFSPPNGARLSVAVSEDQVDSLREAGTVSIKLKETIEGVERSFPGRFFSATPDVSGNVIVEVECDPTPEAAALLAEGKQVKAAFSWRPPLASLWPAQVSFFMIFLGSFGLLVAAVAARRGRAERIDIPYADELTHDIDIVQSPIPQTAENGNGYANTARAPRVKRNRKHDPALTP